MDFTFCIMAMCLLFCLYGLTRFEAVCADVYRVHRTIRRKWQQGCRNCQKQISDFSGMALGYGILLIANMIYPLFGYKPIWRP